MQHAKTVTRLSARDLHLPTVRCCERTRIANSSFLSLPRQLHYSRLRHARINRASQLENRKALRRSLHKLSLAVSGMSSQATEEGPKEDVSERLVQYIILRRDLYETMKWPLGSIIAQACHAATAALWESRDEIETQEYTKETNINHMHKVVLEIKGETQLRNLAAKLGEAGIRHKLWMEQPEDIPTCLAAAPYSKSTVQPYFRKLKLCGS